MQKEAHISILDADHMNLKQELENLKDLGIKHIHLDIGDTTFIPSILFGLNTIKQILLEDFIYDLHFMMNNPMDLIKKIDLKNVNCITIHYEISSFDHCFKELINLKSTYNIEIGIAIKPKTMELPNDVINNIDRLLIMTVEPGFGGQKFMESCASKINYFRSIFKGKIGVDGGIDNNTIANASAADYFIVGSYFSKHKDKKTCIEDLRHIVKNI